MKLPFVLATAIALFCPAAHAVDPPPPADRALGGAFVTIPYSELRALWEAGQAQKNIAQNPDRVPVAAVVNRVDCLLRLDQNASALSAAFEVETLESQWQSILLIGGNDARLEKVEAGDRTVVWQEGYRLLTNQSGKSNVALHLNAPGIKALAENRAIKLELGAATVKTLRIEGIPEGSEARVDGKPAGEVREGVALFYLPGEAGNVSLELAVPRVEKPAEASVWEVRSQVLVTYAEGRLRFQNSLSAHTETGSGKELLLVLPGNIGALEVTGEDLAESGMIRGEDGRRMLRLRWKTAEILDRDVLIQYSVAQSPLAEEWQLAAPATPERGSAKNLFAIVPAEGMELKGEHLNAGSIHRLPQWMREKIGSAAFMTAESDTQLVLKTHWLPEVATAEAVISESQSTLRLVADGSLRTENRCTIRHQTPLTWKLELPEGVELLSCTTNGKAAHPVQRGAGAIELNLPAPKSSSDTGTVVVLVYTAKRAAMDAVSGRVALELPRTALFIEHLEWAIALPPQFEITAVGEGNMAVSTGAHPAPNNQSETIYLSKDLCRAERPAVELFYQRRTLSN